MSKSARRSQRSQSAQRAPLTLSDSQSRNSHPIVPDLIPRGPAQGTPCAPRTSASSLRDGSTTHLGLVATRRQHHAPRPRRYATAETSPRNFVPLSPPQR